MSWSVIHNIATQVESGSRRHIPTPSWDNFRQDNYKFYSSTSSNKQSFVIGLLHSPCWVHTITGWTNPSCPRWVDTVQQNSHTPRRWFGSATRTTVSPLRFCFFSFHFFLSVRLGRYSLVKCLQKKLPSTWDCHHIFVELISVTNFNNFMTRIHLQLQEMIWR